MGHLHLIRSGGIGGTGKTLVASMLFEFCRSRKVQCHFVDAQKFPNIGLKYSPDSHSGDSQIYFDAGEPTRPDRLTELAKDSEVIVDIPAGSDYLVFQWLDGISDLVADGSLSVIDWFINNQTVASWQASQQYVKFWQKLQTNPIQIFVMNGHFATTPGAFPPDARQQCQSNNVVMLFFPASDVVLPHAKPIGEAISKSVYPNSKPLKAWRNDVFGKFSATQLVPELPAADISQAKGVKDLLALVRGKKIAAEIEDAPWI